MSDCSGFMSETFEPILDPAAHRHSAHEAIISGAANACPVCLAGELARANARIAELEKWAGDYSEMFSSEGQNQRPELVRANEQIAALEAVLRIGIMLALPKSGSVGGWAARAEQAFPELGPK